MTKLVFEDMLPLDCSAMPVKRTMKSLGTSRRAEAVVDPNILLLFDLRLDELLGSRSLEIGSRAEKPTHELIQEISKTKRGSESLPRPGRPH